MAGGLDGGTRPRARRPFTWLLAIVALGAIVWMFVPFQISLHYAEEGLKSDTPNFLPRPGLYLPCRSPFAETFGAERTVLDQPLDFGCSAPARHRLWAATTVLVVSVGSAFVVERRRKRRAAAEGAPLAT